MAYQKSSCAVKALQMKARRIRRTVVRLAGTKNGCHLGGSLSVVDILTVLYGHVMLHDPGLPSLPDRDLLVFSKGHAAAALYATLSEFGYFDTEELVAKYNVTGSRYLGHASHAVPGVEFSTGSLGHGVGLGVGLCLGKRLRGASAKVFVIVGDGEMQEGSNWEALHIACQNELSALTVIVDRNGFQNDGPTETILCQKTLPERLRDLGMFVEVVGGHGLECLCRSLNSPFVGAPRAIVADTEKGSGLGGHEVSRRHYAKLSEGDVCDLLSILERVANEYR